MNLVQYLSEKVGRVVLDSDKIFNEGARLLANYPLWEYELEEIIEEAWDTLLKYCIRNKNATHSASVKLTFASDLIGKGVAGSIGIDDTNPKSTLSLGDLLLETFLQEDLIEIFREYNGNKAPYVVRVLNHTDSIKPRLIGTSLTPLQPIAGLRSELTGSPFIKGWKDAESFKGLLDKPFIKALENLRQQPWKLNPKLFVAMLNNRPPEFLEVIDEDGEIHSYSIHGNNSGLPKKLLNKDMTEFLGKNDPKLQRIISKFFEYMQIIGKAEIILDNGNKFYQEVSCDYRGRVYYSESFLEFQGSDIARSLFQFVNKKAVNANGARWLAIHAANCYNQSYSLEQLAELSWTTTDYISHLQGEGLDSISLDKMTLADRQAWANNSSALIFSTNLNNRIDQTAEKPYSFLAVCQEIVAYQKACAAGEEYLSGLPIPIDGSNNGWQHLAAMSKDKQAGELVSLTATPIQKDFYVAVAKELIADMPEWFEKRNMPMKSIRKGISKRGSMTRAYSAGKKRIAKNMYDDCHLEGYTAKYDIDESQCDLLAGNLINAINKVCAGPLKTSKYLQKIAEHELSHGRNLLSWVTPSGFPVIYQAYLQHEHKQRGTIRGIKGNKDGRVMHVIRVNILNKETGEQVPCRRSFASGISPNVVHSYDAAHMANTIVAFNGSFAAVHDSFSAHASDIDFLQDVTKLTFQAQYDVPNFFDILQDTLMENKDTFKVAQPELGSLDINEVTNSEYFFC